MSSGGLEPNGWEQVALSSNSSLLLEKIVPDLMQLSDCLLEREDKRPLSIVAREAKVIECLKRGGDVEMNFNFKAFREPRLYTGRDFRDRR
jgi:hypothetical protein